MSNPQILKEQDVPHTRERSFAGLTGGSLTYRFTRQGMPVTILRGNESKSVVIEPDKAVVWAKEVLREFGGREG